MDTEPLLKNVQVGDTLTHQSNNYYAGQPWRDMIGINARVKVIRVTAHYVDVRMYNGNILRLRKWDGQRYKDSMYRCAPLQCATSHTREEMVQLVKTYEHIRDNARDEDERWEASMNMSKWMQKLGAVGVDAAGRASEQEDECDES